MAVLIEGISVIVRVDRIAAQFKGDFEAFKRLIPNQRFCADRELVQVGFMAPNDAKAFVSQLEGLGLRFLSEQRQALDIVVVDQQNGPTSECGWAEFGRVKIGPDSSQEVAVCRLLNSKVNQVVMPPHWKFEGSLSDSFRFVKTEEMKKEMKFLRREGGVDVYLDQSTGKEWYAGRTGA
jgi:hypothetical protein